MKANICPICEQVMESPYPGVYYCTTPTCEDQQQKDMLFAFEIAAYLKRSKRFVERCRAEAEEWVDEHEEGGEA